MVGRGNKEAANKTAAKAPAVRKAVDISADVEQAKSLDAKAKALETKKDDLLSARGKADQERGEKNKAQALANAPMTDAQRKDSAAEKATLKGQRTKENASIAQEAVQPLADLTKLITSLRAKRDQLSVNNSISKKSDKNPQGRTDEQIQQDRADFRAVRKNLSSALKAKATLMECQMPAAQDQVAAASADLPAQRKKAHEAKVEAEKALKDSPKQKEIEAHKRDTKSATEKLNRANNAIKHPPKLEGLKGEALTKAKGKIDGAIARKAEAEKTLGELKAKEPKIKQLKDEVKPLKDAVQKAEKECKALKKGKKSAATKKCQAPVQDLEKGIVALKQEAKGIDRSLAAEDRSVEQGKQQAKAAERARAAKEREQAELIDKIVARLGGGVDKNVVGAATAALAARDKGTTADKGAGRSA